MGLERLFEQVLREGNPRGNVPSGFSSTRGGGLSYKGYRILKNQGKDKDKYPWDVYLPGGKYPRFHEENLEECKGIIDSFQEDIDKWNAGERSSGYVGYEGPGSWQCDDCGEVLGPDDEKYDTDDGQLCYQCNEAREFRLEDDW